MTVSISDDKFEENHRRFEYHVYLESPKLYERRKVRFSESGFKHRVLQKEIQHKVDVRKDALRALSMDKWSSWKKNNSRKIFWAVKDACRKSGDLLEHRFGRERNSEQVLHKIRGNQTKVLDGLLFDFFKGKKEFGDRFDSLVSFFKQNKLTPQWAFISYLAFLSDTNKDEYIPIREKWIKQLFNLYSIDIDISKSRSWDTYNKILEVSMILKTKLMEKGYGPLDCVEIQTYMWLVYRAKQKPPSNFNVEEPAFHKKVQLSNEDDEEQEQLENLVENERERLKENLRKEMNKETQSPEIVLVNSKRFKRYNYLVAQLKKFRQYKYQRCGITIPKKDGSYYIEGAHIESKNKGGSEKPDNIMILCPNHHKEFDKGSWKKISKNEKEFVFELNGSTWNIDLSIN